MAVRQRLRRLSLKYCMRPRSALPSAALLFRTGTDPRGLADHISAYNIVRRGGSKAHAGIGQARRGDGRRRISPG